MTIFCGQFLYKVDEEVGYTHGWLVIRTEIAHYYLMEYRERRHYSFPSSSL